MILRSHALKLALVGAIALSAAHPALAGDKERNAVIGLGVGALAGAVLSEGDPWVTAGTAAAGGVLGHVLTDDDRRDRRRHKHYYKKKKHSHHPHHRKVRHRWDD